jgi:hypothetical protein
MKSGVCSNFYGINIFKIHKDKALFHYLTSFAKFPAVNGAEYPSKTT